MPNFFPSAGALRRAIQITEQIDSLEAELKGLLDGAPSTAVNGNRAARAIGEESPGSTKRAKSKPRKKKKSKRAMSPEARGRIAAAQKARWAKLREQK